MSRCYRLAVFIVTLALAGVAAANDKPRDPYQYFFDETFYDLTEELENARDQGKKGILLFFEMDECPFCHRMKNTVLNQPDVQAFYKDNFLSFPVDIEGDIEVTDFAGKLTTMKEFAFKQYRVRATPVFAFFTLDGKYIKRARFTGATRDKDEFLLLGKFVADRAWAESSFTRYKRKTAK